MNIQYRGYTISDTNSYPYGYEWYFGDGETLDGPGSKRCGSAGSIQQAQEEIDDDITNIFVEFFSQIQEVRVRGQAHERKMLNEHQIFCAYPVLNPSTLLEKLLVLAVEQLKEIDRILADGHPVECYACNSRKEIDR